MDEFHVMKTALIVKPKKEPIFSERATEVKIEDEAGGMFVEVSQERIPRMGKIQIEESEWPMIKAAIEEMFAVIADAEKKH